MHIERHFTNVSAPTQDKISFMRILTPRTKEIETPFGWSIEATEAMNEAFAAHVPVKLTAVEENTTPSWLWPHRAASGKKQAEKSVTDVFKRIAGSAAYRGWKNGLWDNELAATAFYEEVYALLLSRRLVIAPRAMARIGLDWAYGIEVAPPAQSVVKFREAEALILENDAIDAILRKTQEQAMGKWNRFLMNSQGKAASTIFFADTMREWGSTPVHDDAPSAMINVMAFRKEDGKIDVVGLGQAAKLATLLLELHYETWRAEPQADRPIRLGLANLAGLLMSLGISYDSEKGRGTAAALAAIITATATVTSAQMASLLGSCENFAKQRLACLRVLRNKIRAIFGEKTDYDHLSIVPQALDISSGADLVLISTARYTSEEALRQVEKHGLRNVQLTGFYTDASLAPLLDGSSQGIDAEKALAYDYATGTDTFERRLHPAILLGLETLGYDEADRQAISDHILGYRTLIAAPAINHYLLRQKDFDDKALDKLERALRNANHIRQAFTPWVLGLDFCKKKLKIDAKELEKPSFDLLKHLGFTTQDIDVANAFCCGHRTMQGVAELDPKHLGVFSTRNTIGTEAVVAMAGATQVFITGDIDVTLPIPTSIAPEIRAGIVLDAWKLGLKMVTLESSHPSMTKLPISAAKTMKRQTPSLTHAVAASSAALAKGIASVPSPRSAKPKAPSQAVSLDQPAKPHVRTKH
ncbi:MAG: hypothetical protein EOM37_04220 [Proteobacteria bacterium]|jgi:hypothetical protein|nr:hypothetical protein [Alphaproteobacteria bacterium]NCC03239.1 hypothetical protein [Pseudomonadota bacterium]